MSIELLNIDCMKAMEEMPDKAFDLAIVDPPYGIEKEISTGGGSHTKSAVKFHQLYSESGKKWDKAPGPEYFKELFRVSKNQIIWGGNYFELPPCRCFVVWDKVRVVNNFSQAEYAWTSFDRPAKVFRFCGNAGFILSPEDEKIHPTQKPVSLYRYLLDEFAGLSDKILDTHFGSGSSALACWEMGRDLVGFDTDEEYTRKALARLEQHKTQGSIFV
ncbi:MAG: Phage DNA modification methylase [Microgenomates group bacterium GW2011_GWA2_46_16]|nr:MAG: Phage DNA modification methylase [Microgenomates group bacterium GW2011_GWA2_46_16]HJZ05565.1 DNA methyltransferase [Patescibacteria group bacterium]